MKKILVFLCSILLVFALTGTAGATFITSSGDASLTGATVIDFEDQAMGTYTSITVGDVTFSADNNHLQIDNTYQGYNQSGIYLDNGTYSNNGFGSLKIEFATSTTAFGFTWGMAESWASWQLAAYDSADNLLESYALPSTGPSSAGEFYGIAVGDIAYAQLSWNGAYDWVAIDDFTYQGSAAVPEPATMLLLGAGLIGLAGFGRKKFFKKSINSFISLN